MAEPNSTMSLASTVSDGFMGYQPTNNNTQLNKSQESHFESYTKTCIFGLSPGECECQFTARIVAVSEIFVTQRRQGLRAYLIISVADDETAIDIHLHFDYPCNDQLMTPYGDFQLGDLLRLYVCQVACENPQKRRVSPSKVGYFVTMSDSSSKSWLYKSFSDEMLHRIPFELKDDAQLRSIVSLNTLVIPDDVESFSSTLQLHRRILVLVISCGPMETVDIRDNSRKAERRQIDIVDASCTRAKFTLWGHYMAESASSWVCGKTWLLISDFNLKSFSQAGNLNLSSTSSTRIYVDPVLPGVDSNRDLHFQACQLNKYYLDLTSRDYDTALATKHFTIEEINRRANENSGDVFYGYLTCLILKLDIVTNFERVELIRFTCCFTEQFANNIYNCICRYCFKKSNNFKFMGIINQIIDKTGCIIKPLMNNYSIKSLFVKNIEIIDNHDDAYNLQNSILYTYRDFIFVVDYCPINLFPRIVILDCLDKVPS